MPEKKLLVDALRARLEDALDRLTASQRSVQSGAVHPESRQEHPKDTRAIEAGYLARGLAGRVETLRDQIRAVALMPARGFGPADIIEPGALVTLVDDDGRRTMYLLAPAGGGEKLASGEGEVLVLTPQSPLGAALAGKRCGDAVEVALPSGRLVAEILRIE